ncbi:hypothetical protein LXA43DRAFT_1058962 [Ganoderma leucocontextum]|nr:hypothetical protein LXA43DRAFT_1058962 [Ganoderma leucocontextum]
MPTRLHFPLIHWAWLIVDHVPMPIMSPCSIRLLGLPQALTMAVSEVSAENFVSSIRFDTCITLAAFTLLYYDYALTVTSEIEWYWSPPSPSAPFILFTGSPNTCREIQLYHQVYAMASQAVVAKIVLLILRTYALYNCNKRVLALLICMFVGGTIQSVVAVLTSDSPLSTDIPLNFTFTRCNLSLNSKQGIHLALAWSTMLWFDTTIFALTFYKAIQVRHDMPGTLIVTMFRDGTIYYGILIVVNTVNIITFLLSRSYQYVATLRFQSVSIGLTKAVW